MYFLLKHGDIPASYVGLPEGRWNMMEHVYWTNCFIFLSSSWWYVFGFTRGLCEICRDISDDVFFHFSWNESLNTQCHSHETKTTKITRKALEHTLVEWSEPLRTRGFWFEPHLILSPSLEAMSSIASSGGLVSSGGPYYMISRALGARSRLNFSKKTPPKWPEKGPLDYPVTYGLLHKPWNK